ncbi:MAG: septal ring lytic transglycosylase RlpA family lipoprotein [Myxococcales bacterium]|nr:septal ring lytic transglycosylase RlpA family lipoprotein [Myxococcales bacterium]
MPDHAQRRRALAGVGLLLLVGSASLLGPGCAARGPHHGLAPPGESIPTEKGDPPRGGVPASDMSGEATWYGDRHHGRLTANGETFDMHAFTAAHRTLPFNTIVRVLDHDTRRSVVVRINDRGPRRKRRVIDLSRAAAQELELVQRGVARVSLEVLSWGDGARYRDGRKIVPKRSR